MEDSLTTIAPSPVDRQPQRLARHEVHGRLRTILCTAASALFADLGVTAVEDQNEVTSAGIASVMGFSGPLRGTLLVASSECFFEKTCPTPNVDTADWAGELANQLLGRVKNQLLAGSVEIALATPVAVRGPRLECSLGDYNVAVVFAVADELARIQVDFDIHEPLLWVEAKEQQAQDEGSFELF